MSPSKSKINKGVYTLVPGTNVGGSEVERLTALGDFYGAIEALGDLWPGVGIVPPRNGLSDHEYATLLMHCGILTVELGRMSGRVIENGKDMLTRSVRHFKDHAEGVALARAWLGIAYERCGDLNEAIAVADVTLETEPGLGVTLCCLKTKSIALTGLKEIDLAERVIEPAFTLVEGVDPLLQGKLFLQRGVIRRKQGRLDLAMEDYETAMERFASIGSARYEAVTCNNVANIHGDRGEFSVAHVMIERVIRLFHEIRDQNHEGFAWDTKAQLFRREKKFLEAERAARTAVSILEKGDHQEFLAEALTTHGTILLEYGFYSNSLIRAIEIYEQQNNLKGRDEIHGLLWNYVTRAKEVARDTSKAIFASVRPVEEAHIERVLLKHGGHISPAALELGMSPRGLREKIKSRFPRLESKCQPVKTRRPRRKSIIKE